MFDFFSMNIVLFFSLCKSLGVMVLFIIMKEIRVNMGHTPGLKIIIIIICLVSRACTKVPLFHFQLFEAQVGCQIYLLQTYLKVCSASRSTSCIKFSSLYFEKCGGIFPFFHCIQFIMIFRIASKNNSNNLNEVRC
jgi:hypothetical protein